MYGKFILFFLAILVVSLSAFFIFPQVTIFSDKLTLAICFAALGAQATAMVLFLTSLNAFKKELRVAYILLAIGILLFGVTQMQLPITSIITVDLLKLSWLIVITSLIGAAIIFLAVIKFAGLLKIRTTWLSPIPVIAAALGLALLSSFLPHAPLEGVSEMTSDGIFAIFTASGSLCAAAGLITLRIRTVLGTKYKSAMAWLAAATFMGAFSCLHETIVKQITYFSQFEAYFIYGITLWPFVFTAFLFLLASISFRQTSREALQLPKTESSLEVITYMAQLASNPTELDTVLDKVRHITATHEPGTPFSAVDKATLNEVYIEIETYLTSSEPLRKFDKEDLRDLLPEKFRQQLKA